MAHHKPNILHLHEITVKERGRVQLHTCCILLQYHPFYYFMSSPSINTEMNFRQGTRAHLVHHHGYLKLWYFNIHWNERLTAQGKGGGASSWSWGRLPKASLPLSPTEFPSPSFLGLLLFVFLQVYAWLQLLHQYLWFLSWKLHPSKD